MVVASMDGPTRDQVLRFMRTKEHIEQEIQELTAVVQSQGVTMTEPLVDADGFPRTDIDVYKVRHARHRIICLQNDHKSIMKHIEKGIHLIHAKLNGTHGPGGSDDPGTSEPMDTDADVTHHQIGGVHDSRIAGVVAAANNLRLNERELKPIVRVNFVSAGSPAENAGIRVDDEILEFGSVNAANFKALAQIGDIVQHSVGSQVNVKLKRGSEVLNVTLVPNTWSGRGLLGCNIIPV